MTARKAKTVKVKKAAPNSRLRTRKSGRSIIPPLANLADLHALDSCGMQLVEIKNYVLRSNGKEVPNVEINTAHLACFIAKGALEGVMALFERSMNVKKAQP